MPFIMRKHKFVIWDQLSIVAVAILSAIASLTGAGDISTDIGYLVFGLFWLVSCLTKEPLCATYVKYNYGGEAAHKNPLFMKTNYILAAAWEKGSCWSYTYCRKQSDACIDGHIYRMV